MSTAPEQYQVEKCPVCLRTFSSLEAREAHGKQHRYAGESKRYRVETRFSAGRPFKCVMGCRQSNFVTEEGLQMHYSRFHYQQKVSSE